MQEMLENLHRTKEIGIQSRDLLLAGDLVGLRRADARALAQQAQAVAWYGDQIESTICTRSLGEAASIGGKLVGAGGGGSCWSTRATHRTRGRRWRPLAPPSSPSTSSSSALTRNEYA